MSKEKKAPEPVLKALSIKTQREFKVLKRKELKDVIKALHIYSGGCAYCPGYSKYWVAADALHQLKKLHSVKEWGR